MNQEPPPVPSADPVQAHAVTRTSVAAVWSLVFGVSSFCIWFLGSIPALILGGVALSKINKSQGQLGGKNLAIAGMVTGGLGIVVGVFTMGITAAIMIPAVVKVQERAQSSVEQNNIETLIGACYAFADKNDGKFPEALQDLYPDFINDESVLQEMNRETGELEPYMYFSGKTVNSEPRSLLIASPIIQQQQFRAVGFCDTSVEIIEDAEFYRLAELENVEQ